MPELFHPDLSYQLVGLAFKAHKAVGCFGKERDYCMALENELKIATLPFVRKGSIAGYRVNYIVDNKVVLVVRAKKYLLMDDYWKIKKSLHALNIDLALLLNFKTDFLKPIRIIKGDRAPGAGLPTVDIID
jgi:GxxExxY protein